MIKTVCTLGRRHFPPTKSINQSKLSPETLGLMRWRYDMFSAQAASLEQKALSKKVWKLVRSNLRCSNTRAILLLKSRTGGQRFDSRDHWGETFLQHLKQRMAESLALALRSEKRLRNFMDYCTRRAHTSLRLRTPKINRSEITTALGHFKNGSALGDDDITTELLKAAGRLVLKALAELFNIVIWSKCVMESRPRIGKRSVGRPPAR
ncbi:unnamed protein product [Euphydryas editha]|uniref:Reverse transcriptase n=1 Tax=Euphydryas editha TaxID=104508 RepID=A0AAU9UG82_EUPED|nr:unnamed protein product [Euphydryas editha]